MSYKLQVVLTINTMQYVSWCYNIYDNFLKASQDLIYIDQYGHINNNNQDYTILFFILPIKAELFIWISKTFSLNIFYTLFSISSFYVRCIIFIKFFISWNTDCKEIFATKMVEIGSDEFPFRLEMFFKNSAEIDMRALMAADLGEFT